ncbi:MAG: HlyD family type I secretion periplasmic adaptor subunit [Magnetospirillum sp. WYHS-4]
MREDFLRHVERLRTAFRDPEMGPTHLFVALCGALFAAVLLSGFIGRLDIVAVATGEVIPSTQVKSIQHLEGGIVSEIFVREGEKVAVDQPLLALQTTASEADVNELTLRLAALTADRGRLEAELADKGEPVYPADLAEKHPALVKQSRELFQARRDRKINAVRKQEEAITQHEHAVQEIAARLRNSQNTLKLLGERIDISEHMLKQELSSRLNHLSLLQESSVLKGRIEEDAAGLKRADSALKEARVELASLRQRFVEEATTDLSKARRDLEELSQRLGKFTDNLGRTVLRSPVAGTVKTLYVVTKGGVVQAGKTVADIVPGEDRLVIKARMPTYYIGYLREGQAARIRLAYSDAARFGHLDGRLTLVSPDAVVTDKGAFYEIRIETDRDAFEAGPLTYRLYPGVQVTADVLIGDRSIFEYLLSSFLAGFQGAMREL